MEDGNELKTEGREINAFIIMNFSNMFDVTYSGIESLKDYFYFAGDSLVCSKK